MSQITKVLARQILDSRGSPTIEVELSLSDVKAVASVPSGASTGIHEALELRDHDKAVYRGLGVLKAIHNINSEIGASILGRDFDQNSLDKFLIDLDGTQNKSRLGANAILGVSLAFAKAKAIESGIELYEYVGSISGNKDFKLPHPMFNIINGGKHADSGLDIQEFMLVPLGFESFKKKVQVGSEIISHLKNLLHDKNYSIGVGDEGGFAPKLSSNEEAFDYMVKAISHAGYSTDDVKIGVDVAASSFYHDGTYNIKVKATTKKMSSIEMIAWYEKLIEKYPIISIEDGLSEDDFNGFTEMTKRLGNRIKVVGDDLTVTNIKRINTAIEKNAINSVLIKLNQIGTLTETIQAVLLTKSKGWTPIISHRSGETTDTFIADLVVGLSCPYIKSGSLARGERIAKYNRLMEIEEKLTS